MATIVEILVNYHLLRRIQCIAWRRAVLRKQSKSFLEGYLFVCKAALLPFDFAIRFAV